MRLALVSDSHGELPAPLFERLGGSDRPDRILHLGDLGPPALLAELSVLAPTLAVGGNTDAPGHPELPARRELSAAGLAILMRHEPWSGAELEARDEPGALYLHGHIHRPRLESHGQAWICCPGALVRPRASEASYALLDVTAQQLSVAIRGLADGRLLQHETWPRG